jgi:hypothetical protein
MGQPTRAERRLRLLLRLVGSVCLLALIPLWMPRAWIEGTHEWLGWGPFPAAPVAEYLARSVSGLSAFYGGLLVAMAADVRRYAPLIRYQAVAMLVLSASGAVLGSGAGIPLWFVGGDAVACLAYCLAMLALVRRVERNRMTNVSASMA